LLSQLTSPAPCACVQPARLTFGCPASPHVIFFLGTDHSAAELHLSVVNSLRWVSSPIVMRFEIVWMPWCLSAWRFGLYQLKHVGMLSPSWEHVAATAVNVDGLPPHSLCLN